MGQKKYYISRNYRSLFNAAGKAKTDCEHVLQNLGFKNLGFKQSSIPKSAIGTIKNAFGITFALLKLPFGATLCTQYPNSKFRNYIMFFARLKHCKIITLVHDIKSLQGTSIEVQNELKNIRSHAIIVHNTIMKSWFEKQGVEYPIIVLGIFDYLSSETPVQNNETQFGKTIVYAGGFGSDKNSFIYDVDLIENKDFELKLYGVGFNTEKIKVEKNVSVLNYVGSFPSYEIAHKIEGNFGLVWDGQETKTCSGQYGTYLKYNNPHKTSLYLLSGLPVIVWNEAAIANFILENNVGFVVADLNDLSDKLSQVTAKDYLLMKRNVAKVQNKIASGSYYEEAITTALTSVNS